MTHPPSPPIQPFERLQVTDGLLINADRWRKSHDYHRQRQNLHYQSISQAGIVCGLAVYPIPAPEDVVAQYRDGRWVQIQPGIAIDPSGNPIVIPNPIDFRIAAEPRGDAPLLVYLVISYVDPEKLFRQERKELLQETFRIDEKITPPDDQEVEICRLVLHATVVGKRSKPIQIEPATDVFFPGDNQLDLCHRIQAQPKPQGFVQMAQIVEWDSEASTSLPNLTSLLQASAALYPSLRSNPQVGQVVLGQPPIDAVQAFFGCDLLYATGRQAWNLTDPGYNNIKAYLKQGGVLVVDAPPQAPELAQSIIALAEQLEIPLESLESLPDHPLRLQPFLFSALPEIGQGPIEVRLGSGIILILGGLSAAWGLDPTLRRSRETIRTAQEFGINLLHYAWRRRRLTFLSRPEPLPEPVVEEKSQSKSVFDRLF